MTNEQFLDVIQDVFTKCNEVLNRKRKEYSPDTDRLVNFKVAAGLQGESPLQALGGMLAKHVVSVYDYIERASNGEYISEEAWDEKVIDVVNYMILLKGLIRESLGSSHLEKEAAKNGIE